MHRRKFSYSFAGNVGVQVAPIAGVSVASVKTASRGRRGSSSSCYNRRCIKDLGIAAAGAKMGRFSHRHSQGNKVKWIVPASLRSQIGTRQNRRPERRRHLNECDGIVVLVATVLKWDRPRIEKSSEEHAGTGDSNCNPHA